MRYLFFLTLLFFTSTGLEAQDTIFLGQTGARPFMTVFRPAQKKKTETAVIVCSGGSYGRTADVEEGIPASTRFSDAGLTVFLLDYRPPGRLTEGKDSIPFSDAQTAISYLRRNAQIYNIRPDKIGILGFSAGGHLVSTVGTHFLHDYTGSAKTMNLRPDFFVLVYPVISMADSLTHIRTRANLMGSNMTNEKIIGFSNELQVTDQTPGCFITAAVDDDQVNILNSLYFEAACRQHHVPVDIFLYVRGGHGFGVTNTTADVQWTGACIDWIKNEKWKKG